jgi:hypothetical protein
VSFGRKEKKMVRGFGGLIGKCSSISYYTPKNKNSKSCYFAKHPL